MATHHHPIKDFIAGGFGGVCAVPVRHPLDTIKVRLQTMAATLPGGKPQYSGMLGCLSKTIHKEGRRILSLYRGLLMPCVTVAPVCASGFFGYNVGATAIVSYRKKGHKLTKLEVFGAGVFACFSTSVMLVSTERIKCLLQTQAVKQDTSLIDPIDVAKHLYNRGGLRHLYLEAGATLLRDIPASGMYYLTNEIMRSFFQSLNKNEELTTSQILVCGGMAGISHWAVALPADVLKTRLQTAPEGTYENGIRSVFREAMKNEGITALYRGIVPVMIRTLPTAGSCFVGYELCMEVLHMFF